MPYMLVELTAPLRPTRTFEVWKAWDHEPTTGLGWRMIGPPRSYAAARTRAARINRLLKGR